jgi:thiol-disulfide isomerase/thioredoxin
VRSQWRRALAPGTLLFMASLLGHLPALAAGEFKPWKGGATPSLALKDVEGTAVDVASFRGRVVVINYWATWCEPCRDEMPSLERLRAKMQGRPFELVMVNYGESAVTVNRFLSKLKIGLPVLLDPEMRTARAWGVGGLPMTFIVDAAGRIRYSTFGEQDWSEGEAFRLVEQVVSESARGKR